MMFILTPVNFWNLEMDIFPEDVRAPSQSPEPPVPINGVEDNDHRPIVFINRNEWFFDKYRQFNDSTLQLQCPLGLIEMEVVLEEQLHSVETKYMKLWELPSGQKQKQAKWTLELEYAIAESVMLVKEPCY
jgi:hypothetical protein